MTITVSRQYPAASPTSRLVMTIKNTAIAVAINHHMSGAGTEFSKRVDDWDPLSAEGVEMASEKSGFALLKL